MIFCVVVSFVGIIQITMWAIRMLKYLAIKVKSIWNVKKNSTLACSENEAKVEFLFYLHLFKLISESFEFYGCTNEV